MNEDHSLPEEIEEGDNSRADGDACKQFVFSQPAISRSIIQSGHSNFYYKSIRMRFLAGAEAINPTMYDLLQT